MSITSSTLFEMIEATYKKGISHGDNIRNIMLEITDQIPTRSFPVSERVLLSSFITKNVRQGRTVGAFKAAIRGAG